MHGNKKRKIIKEKKNHHSQHALPRKQKSSRRFKYCLGMVCLSNAKAVLITHSKSNYIFLLFF